MFYLRKGVERVKVRYFISFGVLVVAIILIANSQFFKKQTMKEVTQINIFFNENVERDMQLQLIEDINGTIDHEIESIKFFCVNISLDEAKAQKVCQELENNNIVKAAIVSDNTPTYPDEGLSE